ncbi:hypothetical protein GCM10007304_49740 [Rhodococcoides trifolii]|uniref:EthD domain-containing protein n=1 Tax=Rhodococcoides trifolii TaxID=908250 RepID=A0A917G9S2_9NOCA|nr:EthD family reductase [Rhodococcus trifolii]GGG29996.1 hypothetical protein GCM10007304_49740 [Rhodococcus trifolii]
MVKVVALINARADISKKEFSDHWRNVHHDLVWELPGLLRYVQNHALEHTRDWPFDGMAELWFESNKAVSLAFSSPESEPMRADEKNFIGSMNWFLVEEVERRRPNPPFPATRGPR